MHSLGRSCPWSCCRTTVDIWAVGGGEEEERGEEERRRRRRRWMRRKRRTKRRKRRRKERRRRGRREEMRRRWRRSWPGAGKSGFRLLYTIQERSVEVSTTREVSLAAELQNVTNLPNRVHVKFLGLG